MYSFSDINESPTDIKSNDSYLVFDENINNEARDSDDEDLDRFTDIGLREQLFVTLTRAIRQANEQNTKLTENVLPNIIHNQQFQLRTKTKKQKCSTKAMTPLPTISRIAYSKSNKIRIMHSNRKSSRFPSSDTTTVINQRSTNDSSNYSILLETKEHSIPKPKTRKQYKKRKSEITQKLRPKSLKKRHKKSKSKSRTIKVKHAHKKYSSAEVYSLPLNNRMNLKSAIKYNKVFSNNIIKLQQHSQPSLNISSISQSKKYKKRISKKSKSFISNSYSRLPFSKSYSLVESAMNSHTPVISYSYNDQEHKKQHSLLADPPPPPPISSLKTSSRSDNNLLSMKKCKSAQSRVSSRGIPPPPGQPDIYQNRKRKLKQKRKRNESKHYRCQTPEVKRKSCVFKSIPPPNTPTQHQIRQKKQRKYCKTQTFDQLIHSFVCVLILAHMNVTGMMEIYLDLHHLLHHQ